MKAQLANQKVEIAHLKEKLEASQFDVEALIACKLREKGLEEKLRALALELIEAKRYHSPEMHHYNVLLTRIVSLENKLNQLQEKKELCLQQLAVPSQHALHEVEKKWRVRLLEKDAEIENFRSQIDDILVALNSLNPSQFPRQS
jgi:protein QN1